MSDTLRKGQRVRIKHGRDKGKLATVFTVQGGVHFIVIDGETLDVSYRRSWLLPVSGGDEGNTP